MRTWLTVRAWTDLLYMDLVGAVGFHAVRRVVKGTPTRAVAVSHATVATVVDAMNTACVLYVKPTRCLQRSAVVTRLLRRHGVPADMVIGCHLPPVRAHAWVEIAGEVVSDRQSGMEHYRVLDRW